MQFGSVEIVFEEGVREEEVLTQRLHTLLSSVEGNFVCNRKFGIRSDIVDQPLQIAKASYAADVHDKVEMFIPQLVVEDINFKVNSNMIYPVIVLAANEDYEDEVSDSDIENPEVGEEDEYERD